MAGLDDFSLDGLVALVPGGGGGIGSALAVALAEAGASIVVGGRTQSSLDATVEQVQAAGREGLAVVADATDEADAERLVRGAVERFGRLDILVNAIGGGAGKVLHNAEVYPRSDWDWIMDLNVRSTVVPTQVAARQMIAQGSGGRILNISSVRGNLGIKEIGRASCRERV